MTAPSRPIRLYRHPVSGHAHRVELMLSLLGLPAELVDVDLFGGAQQGRPEFLAKNPFGQVPVIEDGDATVADSNAILVYLATRYDPAGQVAAARCGRRRARPALALGRRRRSSRTVPPRPAW